MPPSPRRRAMARDAQGKAHDDLPADMATAVLSLHELGHLLAAQEKLEPGLYELVVGYKFGPGRIMEGGQSFSALAVAFGGLGLRPTDDPHPMTIEVGGAAKAGRTSISKRTKPPR